MNEHTNEQIITAKMKTKTKKSSVPDKTCRGCEKIYLAQLGEGQRPEMADRKGRKRGRH